MTLLCADHKRFHRVKPHAPPHFEPDGRAGFLARRLLARILDEANREVWTRVGSIGPEQFEAGQADITCDLPLASLEPGAYLLVVEILTAEGTSPALHTSSRLRFGVQ